VSLDYPKLRPHGRLDLLKELRLAADVVRWTPALLTRRPGRAAHPRTVLLLPGFGASPRSMRVMQKALAGRGHRVRDWGLGRNTGEVKRLRAQLQDVVAGEIAAHGEPVALVGWSLGGYVAREYAREHPGQVRKVVTLGTPVIGGPRYTATARYYLSHGHDLDDLERAVAARYATPLQVPVTAIYSKRDGVVTWQACRDDWSPNVRHVEVAETHLGLVLAPRVIDLVAAEIEAG
jgi:pimeloyl-ACP methyl ester carboxylesterase